MISCLFYLPPAHVSSLSLLCCRNLSQKMNNSSRFASPGSRINITMEHFFCLGHLNVSDFSWLPFNGQGVVCQSATEASLSQKSYHKFLPLSDLSRNNIHRMRLETEKRTCLSGSCTLQLGFGAVKRPAFDSPPLTPA